MASVRKRKWTNRTGTHEAWVVTYTERGRRKSGGQYKRKKDADVELRKILEDIENQTHVARREQWTVQQVWEDKRHGWQQEIEQRCRRKQIRQSRVDNIARAMRLYIIPEWETVALTAVTREAVQRWVDRLLNIGPADAPKVLNRRGKPLKVATVRGWVAELSQMLDWAIHKEMGLRRNPLLGDLKGQSIVYPPENARLPVPLEMDDAERVLLWVQNSRNLWQRTNSWASTRIAVLIAFLAGTRAGECCALDWPDIDFERYRLRIWRSYSAEYGMGPTKSGKERTLPISPVLHAALQSYHRWRGYPTDGPVLLDSYNNRANPRVLGSKHWPAAQVKMGLVDPHNGLKLQHRHRFHDLRHTAGSFWIAEGVPLETVSDWLGHANFAFTKRVYIHQLEHDQRGAQGLHQLSDHLVGRMARRGVVLEASQPPKLIEPPKPIGAIPAPELEPLSTPQLTEREERIVELWRQGGYLVDVAREVGVSPQDAATLLERLGIKDKRPRPRPSRFSDEDRAKAIELYLETKPDGSARHTQEWIASHVGAESTTTIREWFRDAGLEERGNGPKAARVSWAKPLDVRQQVLALWQAGVLVREIERLTGCTQGTINRIVRQAGLAPRRRGGNGRPKRVAFGIDAAPVQHGAR